MPGLTTTQRTLVKSPPELWRQVSDPDSLARHFDALGEITITRVTPETAVAWEGDRVRGTVNLEPSGWGTKVTVTAEVEEDVAASETLADVTAANPAATAIAEQAQKPTPRRWWQRLLGRRRPTATPEPALATAPPEPAPVPPPDAAVVEGVLEDLLDHLGAAHHRPFSRA